MTRVFVFGVSGYIGGAVARHFASRGYQVYGLVRTEEKAKVLRRQEIVPVLGKAQEPSGWIKEAEAADIIIEAMADYQDYTSGGIVQKVLIELASKHKDKTIIYTSGVWIYGETTEFADEKSPVNPPDLVKTRVATEKAYSDAGVIIVRPGCVYGHEGSLTGGIFQSLKAGKAEFSGREHGPYWATVHVDDLADAYLLVSQKGESLRGQTFNLVSQSESIGEVVHAAAKVAGFKGEIKFVEPKDPYSVCLALSQKHISGGKARTTLGWNPTHPPLLGAVEKYYHAATAM